MHEDLKYWYLRDHELFQTLNYWEIKQLCITTNFKKAEKGEYIHFSFCDVPRIFLLKKGSIKIIALDKDGKEELKDIIYKGDFFGELALECGDTDISEYAKVLSDDVIICSFLISNFENLLLKKPSLALSYAKFIGLKLRRIKNNYSNLTSKNAKTRLIDFLRDWADKEGVKFENSIKIVNYLTQNDIAQMICTSRHTTNQLINELETKNFLIYNRKEIIIHDILL